NNTCLKTQMLIVRDRKRFIFIAKWLPMVVACVTLCLYFLNGCGTNVSKRTFFHRTTRNTQIYNVSSTQGGFFSWKTEL
ncbi:hypothetical protein AADX85_15350, partial [Staphylococcus epidermidis]